MLLELKFSPEAVLRRKPGAIGKGTGEYAEPNPRGDPPQRAALEGFRVGPEPCRA